MGEKINKQFDDYQKDLEKRNLKLKTLVYFEPDEKLEEVVKELKDKKIVL